MTNMWHPLYPFYIHPLIDRLLLKEDSYFIFILHKKPLQRGNIHLVLHLAITNLPSKTMQLLQMSDGQRMCTYH